MFSSCSLSTERKGIRHIIRDKQGYRGDMRQDEERGLCHVFFFFFFPLIEKGFPGRQDPGCLVPGPPHYSLSQRSHSHGCFIAAPLPWGLARCTDGGHPFRTIPGPLDTSRSYLESSEQRTSRENEALWSQRTADGIQKPQASGGPGGSRGGHRGAPTTHCSWQSAVSAEQRCREAGRAPPAPPLILACSSLVPRPEGRSQPCWQLDWPPHRV